MKPVAAARNLLHEINGATRSAVEAARASIQEHRQIGGDAAHSIEDLQTYLFRFEGRFGDRLRTAIRPLDESDDPEIRLRALKLLVGYGASVLDIAVSPRPEVSLVDMIVLIEVSADVMERYLVPEVFGPAGAPLAEAFRESSRDIWNIASAYLSAEEKLRLAQAIDLWVKEHPQQHDVIAMRFSGVLEAIRESPLGEKEQQLAMTLIPPIGAALKTADASRLFGERALYYAQRAPFLIRDHVRASIRESLHEARLALRDPALKRFLKAGGAIVTGSLLGYFALKRSRRN